MTVSTTALRIAQISDIHCGEPTFDRDLLRTSMDRINRLKPDIVIVAGDLTGGGYEWEFQEAAKELGKIRSPRVVVPGNHDSRHVGYIHFERYFGERFISHRLAFESARAERLRATGLMVAAVDSSSPDLDEGHVGREHYPWIWEQFSEPDDFKLLVLHHHLVSIPGTGRERNIITDAGDLLAEIAKIGVDIVLSGHKHVPFFWGVNGMLICNSGTASTRRLRGLTPRSFNEIQIDASTIKVYLHYPDGRRELSLIFSLRTRAIARDDFYLTEEFEASNHIFAGSSITASRPEPT
jgi:3',5'-cyclic AMP phosphodiesterase CpdA